jgi:hypothetical protein
LNPAQHSTGFALRLLSTLAFWLLLMKKRCQKLHHAKANKCLSGQNVCFTKDNGPCHKRVTTPDHAPVIIATRQDWKKSKQIADEHGWEMDANDLADQIRGMEQVLAELQLPADQRPKR